MLRKINLAEFIFQCALFATVFVFYISRKANGETVFLLQLSEFCLFLNYVFAALVINYIFLPKLLYRKRYTAFLLGLTAMVGLVMWIEEGILEKIFYPLTRGANFHGVFFNLIGILPILAILIGGKFAWDALHKQRKLEELQALVRDSELQFLQSQINPHFLFNNLNNLYAHALENSPQTPEIILQLSDFLRYMLYQCREKFVPLSQELTQLENFAYLSSLQLENRGAIAVKYPQNTHNFYIAPLILPVFIENAIKHSLSSKANDIQILIDINIDKNGALCFKCRNNFTEISNTQMLSKGIGLENVKKRLDILYPDAHSLEISSQNDIFHVHLSLALHEKD